MIPGERLHLPRASDFSASRAFADPKLIGADFFCLHTLVPGPSCPASPRRSSQPILPRAVSRDVAPASVVGSLGRAVHVASEGLPKQP